MRTANLKRYFSLFFFFLFWHSLAGGITNPPNIGRSEGETSVSTTSASSTPLNFGLDLAYSNVNYPNYQWQNQLTKNERSHGFRVDFSWLPVTSLGKLAFGVGAGMSFFRNIDLGGGQFASLTSYPVNASLGYRLDYWEKQILVPYGKVSSTLVFTHQSSQTGAQRNGMQRYYGLELTGGLSLNLSSLDPSAAKNLDRSAGVNGTYVFVEYTKTQALKVAGSNIDLSTQEYRAGLRFEL